MPRNEQMFPSQRRRGAKTKKENAGSGFESRAPPSSRREFDQFIYGFYAAGADFVEAGDS